MNRATNQVILWVKRKREQNWKGASVLLIDTAYLRLIIMIIPRYNHGIPAEMIMYDEGDMIMMIIPTFL